ncbi:hypothetical protein DDZ13_05610 [Coraliomargarita sinensis]|uniref:FecR protein domain-containing protein n=1 Tax=Coraliomargarita sinensis TaxID=2174842 RepID=A0A317ZLE6_9BACT|nr:hypothetical protein [Coraliomargarita sinensis]PXA04649.1 hypothetical protein DDZ13_05610 [Coraliomargarita sinensis]
MNTNFHNNAEDFRALVERVLNGEATSGDLKRFNEALASDKAARRCYMEMQMFDAALRDEVNAASGERLEASGEAIVFEQEPPATSADSSNEKPSSRWAFKYYALAAMLALAAVMAVLFTTKAGVFEVVFVDGVERGDFSPSSKWISAGDQIVLPEGGVVEFKSEDNRFALKGPAELLVGARDRLSLTKGSIWAELEGDPVRISVPNGEIVDIGTILGVFVDEKTGTRLDVFDGKARMTSAQDVARSKVISAGQSLMVEGLDWRPLVGVADMGFYVTTAPKRLGLNFIEREEEAVIINSTRPYSAKWQNVTGSHGSHQLANSPVRATWAGGHTFGRGKSDTPEDAILNGGLTTKAWRPVEVKAAQSYGFRIPGTSEQGAVVQLSNLGAWLKSSQADKYRLTLFCNVVRRTDGPYSPIRIYEDATMSGSPIHQWNPESENIDTFIRKDRGPGREYYIKEIEYDFSGDSLVIHVPSGAERTHLSAIMLTLVE